MNLSSLRMLSASFFLFSALVPSSPHLVAQTTPTSALQHTTLHSFGGPDGAAPLYGVIADKTGSLYGTTVFGGDVGGGSVFKLTPTKSGYSEKVLYSFLGGGDG